MSRIGKQIIEIPNGTTVELTDSLITVKGPKGTLVRDLNSKVKVVIEGNEARVEPVDNDLPTQALWGTFSSLLRNMVTGVNTPFERKLVVEGVGYRAEMQGADLVLNVGFSHPVKFSVPEGLTASVEKNVITIAGADKESVGQFAATVRASRKPEPYKGKGIRYDDEVIRRKQGKKSV